MRQIALILILSILSVFNGFSNTKTLNEIASDSRNSDSTSIGQEILLYKTEFIIILSSFICLEYPDRDKVAKRNGIIIVCGNPPCDMLYL